MAYRITLDMFLNPLPFKIGVTSQYHFILKIPWENKNNHRIEVSNCAVVSIKIGRTGMIK